MASLFDDVTAGRIEWLCDQTRMPAEVTRRLLSLPRPQGLDAERFAQAFTDPDRAEAAYQGLEEQLRPLPEPWGWQLGVQLWAALKAQDGLYCEKGIDEQVFTATMGCFARFVREHRASFGQYGFDRGWWTWHQTGGLIFRVGTLEFQMTTPVRACLAAELGADAPVLSVHIPSDAILSRPVLDDAYRQAATFFALHYPGFRYRAACCASWLLSPTLSRLLKPGSGILTFGEDYTLLGVDADSDDAMLWLFGRPAGAVPVADLPEDTSLRRGAKQLMLAGGHVGEAAGLVERGGRRFSADCNPFGEDGR